MKRYVTIRLEFDPTEYQDGEDSPKGAIDLVAAMLREGADLPEDNIIVECEGLSVDLYSIPEEELPIGQAIPPKE